MQENAQIKQEIVAVEPGSPAARAGITAGMMLLSMNGEPVRDLIDYTYLADAARLRLGLERGGKPVIRRVRKEEGEPLGLVFATGLMSKMRTCQNHCLFCFIDQMPSGTRTSLHIKDDDWRMSFIMGNYVSLTNVSDEEFSRILSRRVGPLYVSVHATDQSIRTQMMRNPTAGLLMNRLSRLKENGLTFHAQIVLCPGVNDGAILDRSLSDLLSLTPSCRSIAVIPVGLTRFRDGLTPLRGYSKQEAACVVEQLLHWREAFCERLGEPGLFLSDEWYLLAELPLPSYDAYADFPQIENGVGLLRRFESEMLEALSGRTPLLPERTVDVLGGTAAYPFFSALYPCLAVYGIHIRLHPIENRFFGGNVRVAGLVTGRDILEQVDASMLSDTVMLPGNMLREGDDVLLDDIRIRDLSEQLHTRVIPFYDGEDFIEKLFEV